MAAMMAMGGDSQQAGLAAQQADQQAQSNAQDELHSCEHKASVEGLADVANVNGSAVEHQEQAQQAAGAGLEHAGGEAADLKCLREEGVHKNTDEQGNQDNTAGDLLHPGKQAEFLLFHCFDSFLFDVGGVWAANPFPNDWIQSMSILYTLDPISSTWDVF